MAEVVATAGTTLFQDDGEGGLVPLDLQSIFNGEGAPSDELGVNGDSYIDRDGPELWGPKADGSWRDTGPISLGGGAVTSVNRQTGSVVLDADDVSAAPSANAVGHVAHGSTSGASRPTGYAVVVWVGSVDPTNKRTGDLWVRTA